MKPFTIIVQETEQQIVDTINKSNLPAYVLKQVVRGIYEQLDQLELSEIEEYNKQQEKKNKKKESDK